MHSRTLIPLLAVAALAAMPRARAAEQITLSNGFVEQCDHHATVEDHVRLYLNAGEDSYIDLVPAQIASIEIVSDPKPDTAPPTISRSAELTPADLSQMLTRAGEKHNLDVDLLASIVKAESNGNTHAVSRAGAQGLMQLMPKTANDLGVQDSFAPDQNVQGGSAYIDALLTHYHDNLALALAAYNAGPQAVEKYHGIPPYRETRLYVARVIHEFNRRVIARQRQSSNVPRSSEASNSE
jgi:soluble lytic murein transglycosylase-like protein